MFKGVWKFTEVAIKRIERGTDIRGNGAAEINKLQLQQSLNELRFLNACRHDNILPIYGYAISSTTVEPCLVYQLMIGGSLEQRLSAKEGKRLTWEQRLNIARGTAR